MFGYLMSVALQNLLYFALHMEFSGSFPHKLSRQEEAEVILQMKSADPKIALAARNKLVRHNMRLVNYIVRRKFSDARDAQEDLFSIGLYGLLKAADSFKSEKGAFSTYASTCIENQIKMQFRSNSKTPPGISIDDDIDVDKDGHSIKLSDIIPDPVNIEEEVDKSVYKAELYRALLKLEPREREIICLRYGLPQGNGETSDYLTQHEVARRCKISRSYVSRIEKRTIEKLCKILCDELPPSAEQLFKKT